MATAGTLVEELSSLSRQALGYEEHYMDEEIATATTIMSNSSPQQTVRRRTRRRFSLTNAFNLRHSSRDNHAAAADPPPPAAPVAAPSSPTRSRRARRRLSLPQAASNMFESLSHANRRQHSDETVGTAAAAAASPAAVVGHGLSSVKRSSKKKKKKDSRPRILKRASYSGTSSPTPVGGPKQLKALRRSSNSSPALHVQAAAEAVLQDHDESSSHSHSVQQLFQQSQHSTDSTMAIPATSVRAPLAPGQLKTAQPTVPSSLLRSHLLLDDDEEEEDEDSPAPAPVAIPTPKRRMRPTRASIGFSNTLTDERAEQMEAQIPQRNLNSLTALISPFQAHGRGGSKRSLAERIRMQQEKETQAQQQAIRNRNMQIAGATPRQLPTLSLNSSSGHSHSSGDKSHGEKKTPSFPRRRKKKNRVPRASFAAPANLPEDEFVQAAELTQKDFTSTPSLEAALAAEAGLGLAAAGSSSLDVSDHSALSSLADSSVVSAAAAAAQQRSLLSTSQQQLSVSRGSPNKQRPTRASIALGAIDSSRPQWASPKPRRTTSNSNSALEALGSSNTPPRTGGRRYKKKTGAGDSLDASSSHSHSTSSTGPFHALLHHSALSSSSPSTNSSPRARARTRASFCAPNLPQGQGTDWVAATRRHSNSTPAMGAEEGTTTATMTDNSPTTPKASGHRKKKSLARRLKNSFKPNRHHHHQQDSFNKDTSHSSPTGNNSRQTKSAGAAAASKRAQPIEDMHKLKENLVSLSDDEYENDDDLDHTSTAADRGRGDSSYIRVVERNHNSYSNDNDDTTWNFSLHEKVEEVKPYAPSSAPVTPKRHKKKLGWGSKLTSSPKNWKDDSRGSNADTLNALALAGHQSPGDHSEASAMRGTRGHKKKLKLSGLPGLGGGGGGGGSVSGHSTSASVDDPSSSSRVASEALKGIFSALQSIDGSMSWTEGDRAIACREIQAEIVRQQQRSREMDRLIDHTMQFVAARIESQNKIGVIVDMKKIFKYEALKLQALNNVSQLQELIWRVQEADHAVDYQSKVKAILSEPPPAAASAAASLHASAASLQQSAAASFDTSMSTLTSNTTGNDSGGSGATMQEQLAASIKAAEALQQQQQEFLDLANHRLENDAQVMEVAKKHLDVLEALKQDAALISAAAVS